MKKRTVLLTIFALFGIIITTTIAVLSFREAKRDNQINNEIEKLRQEAEKIRANNKELREKISYYQTSEFQERVAKEKLNLQKPDEQVVVVKPSPYYEEIEKNLNDVPEQKPEENMPNYKKWWNYFFK